MSMSFRLDWTSVGAAVALATLVSTACQTPGEDFQETPAGGTGGSASNLTATATTNPVTGSDAGGTNAAATSDATSTVNGASATSTEGASASTDSGSSTDGASSGGAGSTDSTTTTDGGGSGSNLIQNGDFSSSEAPCAIDESDWLAEGTLNWSGADEETCSYCVVLDPDQSGQLNWSGNAGTPPTLDPGNYRFAFDVWSPEGEMIPSVSAKVGQPVDPYMGFVEEEVNVTSSQATQSFNFTMANADQAGIAFFFSVGGAWGKVCFDNVVIEAQ
jgi:hypothetical protein